MLIATAGHVDHGKTSLIRALTGVDTDRLPEEKARGLTIDLGFAHFQTGGDLILSFVDVPGHERFVRNMVAGVGAIDLALLVVAADDGIMPQTLEHLDILQLLGITRALAAITKCDRVDEARAGEVEIAVGELLSDKGFQAAAVLRASGVSGDGIEQLRATLIAEARLSAGQRHGGGFRLAVDRQFTVPGAGLVVTGTAWSGKVAVGDRITVSPMGRGLRVRGLRVQDRDAKTGSAGQRLALNLAGDMGRRPIGRGDWVLDPELHSPATRIDVRLRVLAGERRPLKHWTPGHFHHGAVDIPCRIAVLAGWEIEPGTQSYAQIVLERPTAALWGDKFVLRDQSAKRTVAGGVVIDPFALARGRSRPERLAWLEAARKGDEREALMALLSISAGGFDLARFALSRNVEEGAVAGLVADAGGRQLAGGYAIAEDHWTALKDRLLATVAAHHQARPEDQGPGDNELIKSLGGKVALPLVQGLMQALKTEGLLVASGGVMHLPGHRAQPSEHEARLWARIEPLLRETGKLPPREREIAEELNVALQTLQNFFRRGVRLGLVWRVSNNRVFVAEGLLELGQMAEALAAASDDGRFTAAQFRDRSGIGRNLTIEVLEFFDSAGLTRRAGDGRRVVRTAVELFGGEAG